ncbi:MAG: DUF427 domain-containing protein [Cryobacterium sp.]
MTKAVESVWDYPRPPRVEASAERVIVRFDGAVIAETDTSFRVLETSHPPTYYLPVAAFRPGVLQPGRERSVCEFKGVAGYFDLVGASRRSVATAWSYPEPLPGYEQLLDHVAVYPARMDACSIDGESVTSQDGDFYGGWITARITGPFKGAPGTLGW